MVLMSGREDDGSGFEGTTLCLVWNIVAEV